MKWGVVAQSPRARESCKKILDRAETYESYFVFLVANIKNGDVLSYSLLPGLIRPFLMKSMQKRESEK